MNEKINPSNIKDYTEKTWFLGTDLFEDPDLNLMNEGKAAMMTCDAAAMYSTSHLKENPNFYEEEGYSIYFQEVMKEALKRDYRWVVFDRDLSSI